MRDIIKRLVEISRIAAAIDTIDPSDQEACQTLLKDALALEKSHMEFHTQIEPQIGKESATYARGELQTGIPATDDLFGPAYRFANIDDALLHMFFWLSLSFVHPLIRECQLLAGKDRSCYSQDEALRLSTYCVGQAARAFPYCAQDGMNLWGMYYGVLCAVQTARVHSHVRDWDLFLWAMDVFNYLKVSGFEHAARACDIWSAYWFDTSKHHYYRTVDYRKLTTEYNGNHVYKEMPEACQAGGVGQNG